MLIEFYNSAPSSVTIEYLVVGLVVWRFVRSLVDLAWSSSRITPSISRNLYINIKSLANCCFIIVSGSLE